MNDFIIATVSTSDLSADYMKEHNIPFISYTYSIDEEILVDDCTEESRINLYKAMREGKMPSTSQISKFAYYDFFKSLLETGKDVIFVDMSRAISNSIVNAESAMDDILPKYPNQKFHFIDSFCITAPLGLLVKQLVLLKEEGKSFEEVVSWGENHKKEYIHRFMVDDLQWLRKGGRLSNASAMVGTLLSIKPLLYVTNEGKLVAFSKVHGRKKCLHALVESMKDDLAEYSALEEIAIIQADDYEDALNFRELIKETYPELENANITINTLGPVIAAHVGPGFMAITYHGTQRVM